jgi:5-methylcytosine-specific restriction endonuclease McrA
MSRFGVYRPSVERTTYVYPCGSDVTRTRCLLDAIQALSQLSYRPIDGNHATISLVGYKNKNQQREYQRQWIAKNRAKWISENGPCKKCGSSEKLEVDHRDPSSKINHNVWSWSEERRAVELKKCWVLCHKCHSQKTADERGRAEHGTNSKYTGPSKCRCNECRTAHAKVNALYR